MKRFGIAFASYLIGLTPILHSASSLAQICIGTDLQLQDTAEFQERMSLSTVKINLHKANGELEALGTGTVVSKDGYILTAGHIFPSTLPTGSQIRMSGGENDVFDERFSIELQIEARQSSDSSVKLDYALLKAKEEMPSWLRPMPLTLVGRPRQIRVVGFKIDSRAHQPSNSGLFSHDYPSFFTATNLAAHHGFSGAVAAGDNGRGVGILLGRYRYPASGELTIAEIDDQDNGALAFLKLRPVIDDLTGGSAAIRAPAATQLLEYVQEVNDDDDLSILKRLGRLDAEDPFALLQLLSMLHRAKLDVDSSVALQIFHIALCLYDPYEAHRLFQNLLNATGRRSSAQAEQFARDAYRSLANFGRDVEDAPSDSGGEEPVIAAYRALLLAYGLRQKMAKQEGSDGTDEFLGLDLHNTSLKVLDRGYAIDTIAANVLATLVERGPDNYVTWLAAMELFQRVEDYNSAAFGAALATTIAPSNMTVKLARDFSYLAGLAEARGELDDRVRTQQYSRRINGYDDLLAVANREDIVLVQLSTQLETCELELSEGFRCRGGLADTAREVLGRADGSGVVQGLDLGNSKRFASTEGYELKRYAGLIRRTMRQLVDEATSIP